MYLFSALATPFPAPRPSRCVFPPRVTIDYAIACASGRAILISQITLSKVSLQHHRTGRVIPAKSSQIKSSPKWTDQEDRTGEGGSNSRFYRDRATDSPCSINQRHRHQGAATKGSQTCCSCRGKGRVLRRACLRSVRVSRERDGGCGGVRRGRRRRLIRN